jgi:hypothetical protein
MISYRRLSLPQSLFSQGYGIAKTLGAGLECIC